MWSLEQFPLLAAQKGWSHPLMITSDNTLVELKCIVRLAVGQATLFHHSPAIVGSGTFPSREARLWSQQGPDLTTGVDIIGWQIMWK